MRPRPLTPVLAFALAGLATVPALGDQKEGNERVDKTAYTLKSGEFSLGILEAQGGVTREVLVGTYVPTWFAFPFLGVPVPSAFVKVRDPWKGPLTLSGRLNFLYVDADVLASEILENSGGDDASVYLFPLEAAASYRFNRVYSQSLTLTYVAVTVDGKHESDASIHGAAALTNLSLGAFSEWRLTRVLALTLLLKAMVYRGNAHVRANFVEGSTAVSADLGAADPISGLVACAVPGVSLSFSHVNLELGLGYGHFWLPIVQLPLPRPGLVPEANFYVRF